KRVHDRGNQYFTSPVRFFAVRILEPPHGGLQFHGSPQRGGRAIRNGRAHLFRQPEQRGCLERGWGQLARRDQRTPITHHLPADEDLLDNGTIRQHRQQRHHVGETFVEAALIG